VSYFKLPATAKNAELIIDWLTRPSVSADKRMRRAANKAKREARRCGNIPIGVVRYWELRERPAKPRRFNGRLRKMRKRR